MNVDPVVLVVLGIAALAQWLSTLMQSGTDHVAATQHRTSRDPASGRFPRSQAHHTAPRPVTGAAMPAREGRGVLW